MMSSNPTFREGTKAAVFIELARPDQDGFSRKVSLAELEEHGLGMGNGGSWCRRDSALGMRYNIHRELHKGKIVAVALHGFNQLPARRAIRADIKKVIKKQRCAVLDTGHPECDHKDGRIYDKPVMEMSQQSEEDFQALSKAANMAKRQHCRKCKETGQRYDARNLGYSIPQFKGNGIYRGSCVGCYWHDPRAFNRAVSDRASRK